MIVLETSAIVAYLLEEPEKPRIADALAAADAVVISAFSRYEAMVVMGAKRLRGVGPRDVDLLLARCLARVIPFDAEQSTLAFQAYARFGKGSGSAARLNLADCAAYALARSLDAPLLFVGDDFARTDVATA